MKYQPITGVWEITMGCNMRCMHCGSSCESALEDELSSEEALKLCDDIGDMGLKWITLSGGEPFTRKDWYKIVDRLSSNGVMANMISNGWMLDKETLRKAKQCNVSTIAISVDGTEEIHDEIRKKDSFRRLSEAFELMHEIGITSGAVTTVSTKNMDILNDIKEFLISKNVSFWQLQIGLPMGNMAKNSDMTIMPKDIDRLLDFIYETAAEGRIKVYPADCIGYYNQKESEIRKILFQNTKDTHWDGCHAGQRSFGILQNGDILGCTSIRNKEFVEGNIRARSLKEIWEDPDNFKWSREMSKNKLEGNCKICDFGDICKGGCPNTRLTTKGDIYKENKYCSFNYALDKTKDIIKEYKSDTELLAKAQTYAKKGEFTLSYLVLDELLSRDGNSSDTLNLMGYVAFMLGDYEKSKEINIHELRLNPDNWYALKGLGLAEYRLGEDYNGAIEKLIKATKLDTTNELDSYHDLATVYYELGMMDKARVIIEEGINKSEIFAHNIKGLSVLCSQ